MVVMDSRALVVTHRLSFALTIEIVDNLPQWTFWAATERLRLSRHVTISTRSRPLSLFDTGVIDEEVDQRGTASSFRDHWR
ncbi:hypothetical protein [Rhodococcus koreensis]